MMNIFDPLSIPLGRLMHFIYYTVSFENYGLALIIFTLLTRLAMLPLTIKQYQGTAKMQKLNPRLEELKRQYGTDKKKLQEETMKLYQEEKVNPAGGCLPLLIQFPILFSLYPVITRPLRYMLGKSQEQIAALQELYSSISGNTAAFIQEMEVLNFFKNDPASLSRAQSMNLLAAGDLINMNFFGLDLSRTPTYSPDILFGEQSAIYLPLLLIPIIGVISTYISGKFSMASSAAQGAQNQQASSMGKSMQVIGPVMTLIFSFQLPAGVLIYWIAGYMIQIVQQLLINKYILKLDNILGGFSRKKAGDVAPGRPGAQLTGAQGQNSGGQKQLAGAQGQNSGTQGQNSSGQKQIAGDLNQFTNNQGEQERLYDGYSTINRIVSSLGGTGGTGVRDPGSEGIVHGGSFRPNVSIPGVTDDYDDGADEAGDINTAGADAGDDIDGPGGAAGGPGAKTGDSDGKGGGSGGSPAASGKQQQNQKGGQRVDARSSTQKNYGSNKKKKKKK